jgi:hypothetical protein
MSFFRKESPAHPPVNGHQPRRTENRAMARVEAEARVLITTLAGESCRGVMRNMNAKAIAAHVQADLEPGNRVTISYYTDDPDEQIEVQAIVRRRNGFLYVLDTSLVDVIDEHRESDSVL